MAVALDVFILVLPMPLLGRLKLNKGKKIGIVLMFSTAVIALACAILTTIYRVKLRGSTDPFWTSWESTIFNVIENNVAIIVACVPGTFSFIKTYLTPARFPSLLNGPFKGLLSLKSTSTHSRKRSDNGGNGGMGGLTPHISSPVCAVSPGHFQHYKQLHNVKNVQHDAFGQKVYGEKELIGDIPRMGNTLQVPPKDRYHQRNVSNATAEMDISSVGIAYGSGLRNVEGWREKNSESEDKVDSLLRQMEMEQMSSRFST
ncbi:hypothetical protein GLAREA_02177 [Glarea lozoyensis ATCC 20868]|uniref:Rhodopsin domain-containing protein n=1 Tax=Glarea lozoyensis (strain ATCC 20868 / MF5171) TaxID=1116229 RepID=S3CKK0_GLAL2|nr:uncharacterized protein GLAREA_02177 [Glarea lozoyensis ATCC 20868]EPE26265.1 hypothetical protein GLAREA_02177 [Glarea lozoyensis ATCC 20868]